MEAEIDVDSAFILIEIIEIWDCRTQWFLLSKAYLSITCLCWEISVPYFQITSPYLRISATYWKIVGIYLKKSFGKVWKIIKNVVNLQSRECPMCFLCGALCRALLTKRSVMLDLHLETWEISSTAREHDDFRVFSVECYPISRTRFSQDL